MGTSWTQINSSNIDAAKYDADKQLLTVRFKFGAVYEYSGVPEDVAQGLFSATSAGAYLHNDIASEYPYNRVS